jgi:hypothetical protein
MRRIILMMSVSLDGFFETAEPKEGPTGQIRRSVGLSRTRIPTGPVRIGAGDRLSPKCTRPLIR